MHSSPSMFSIFLIVHSCFYYFRYECSNLVLFYIYQRVPKNNEEVVEDKMEKLSSEQRESSASEYESDGTEASGGSLVLPPHWYLKQSRSRKGRIYYANAVLKTVTWELPSFSPCQQSCTDCQDYAKNIQRLSETTVMKANNMTVSSNFNPSSATKKRKSKHSTVKANDVMVDPVAERNKASSTISKCIKLLKRRAAARAKLKNATAKTSLKCQNKDIPSPCKLKSRSETMNKAQDSSKSIISERVQVKRSERDKGQIDKIKKGNEKRKCVKSQSSPLKRDRQSVKSIMKSTISKKAKETTEKFLTCTVIKDKAVNTSSVDLRSMRNCKLNAKMSSHVTATQEHADRNAHLIDQETIISTKKRKLVDFPVSNSVKKLKGYEFILPRGDEDSSTSCKSVSQKLESTQIELNISKDTDQNVEDFMDIDLDTRAEKENIEESIDINLLDTSRINAKPQASRSAIFLVVDTNILIHKLNLVTSLSLSSANRIYDIFITIPHVVLEELDALKQKNSVSKFARRAISWCHTCFTRKSNQQHKVRGQTFEEYLNIQDKFHGKVCISLLLSMEYL